MGLQASFASTASTPPTQSIIESGEIGCRRGRMQFFKSFWIYGTVSRLVCPRHKGIRFKDISTESQVSFTVTELSIESPYSSVKVDKTGNMAVSTDDANTAFIAFDSRDHPATDVDSLIRLGSDISIICLINSKDSEVLERLRGEALDLIHGRLVPCPLPVGSLLACATVKCNGVPYRRPAVQISTEINIVPWNYVPPPTFDTYRLQLGVLRRERQNRNAGTYLSSVLVFGGFSSRIPFDDYTVLIDDGYHKLRLTSESIDIEHPKLAMKLDTCSGHATIVDLPEDGISGFSYFMASDRSKNFYKIEQSFWPTARCYICFLFAPDDYILHEFRANLFDLLSGKYQPAYLVPGGLVVCAQVIKTKSKNSSQSPLPTGNVSDTSLTKRSMWHVVEYHPHNVHSKKLRQGLNLTEDARKPVEDNHATYSVGHLQESSLFLDFSLDPAQDFSQEADPRLQLSEDDPVSFDPLLKDLCEGN